MGKVKNKRRLHNKAAKVAKDAEENNDMELELPSISRAASVAGGGIFSNVKIDMNALEGNLPDLDDARSVISSKSLRGLNMSKKDKRKVRHEFLMKKIDVLQSAKREAKKKKKREQTVVVGDLQPLEDTLPTLELLLKKTSKQARERPVAKAKGINKAKKRQKDMLSDINLFKQVIQHPAYKSNPMATISEHLQNKHKMEEKKS